MRERDIWTLEVHDILEANKDQLRVLLNWWVREISMKNGRKAIHFEEVQDMLGMYPRALQENGTLSSTTFGQETRLTVNHVKLAFANSKFILTDEMEEAQKLYVLKYDEFLEFVVRMADLSSFDGPPAPPQTDDNDDKKEGEESHEPADAEES